MAAIKSLTKAELIARVQALNTELSAARVTIEALRHTDAKRIVTQTLGARTLVAYFDSAKGKAYEVREALQKKARERGQKFNYAMKHVVRNSRVFHEVVEYAKA